MGEGVWAEGFAVARALGCLGENWAGQELVVVALGAVMRGCCARRPGIVPSGLNFEGSLVGAAWQLR